MEVLSWIREQETLAGWLLVVSVTTFFGSLILVPWLLIRLPADYFSRAEKAHRPIARQPGFVRPALIVAKNALGALFVIAGIAMLVLPGQGVLTMMAGVILMDFPGKYRLEKWFISRPRVAASVNWLRKKANREPLELD